MSVTLSAAKGAIANMAPFTTLRVTLSRAEPLVREPR
jgi:hypothetical protein